MNVKSLPPSCRGMYSAFKQAVEADLAVVGSAVADGTLRGCGVAASPADVAVAEILGSGESFEWGTPGMFEGLPDDEDIPEETKPGEFLNKVTVGEWTTDNFSAEVSPVNFGVACGNWAGHMYWDLYKNHMYWDTQQNPSDVFCAQEMEADFCRALNLGCVIGSDRKQGWLVIRGAEKGNTTAVGIRRNGPFKGIRRECFVIADGGSKKGHPLFNRLLFVTLKFKKPYFNTRTEDTDELGFCCAHLDHGCVYNRTLGRTRKCYKEFWDRLAQGIMQHKTRFLCLDANKALPMVAIELRARGVCVTMVAWYPCIEVDTNTPMLDSIGIFTIGRTTRIRPAYSPTVVGGLEPKWGPTDNYNLTEIMEPMARLNLIEVRHDIQRFNCGNCPGQRLESYDRGERTPGISDLFKYLQYSCTPIRQYMDDTMQAVLQEKMDGNQQANSMRFGGKKHMHDFGLATFIWPTLPEVRQEPLELNGKYNVWNNGHMTIRVIITGPAGDHRLEEKRPEVKTGKMPGAARRTKKQLEGTKGKANPKGYQSTNVGKSCGKGSSAVAEKDPFSSSASHRDPYEVFKAGGQTNETFTAGPWKYAPCNLPLQTITYQ